MVSHGRGFSTQPSLSFAHELGRSLAVQQLSQQGNFCLTARPAVQSIQRDDVRRRDGYRNVLLLIRTHSCLILMQLQLRSRSTGNIHLPLYCAMVEFPTSRSYRSIFLRLRPRETRAVYRSR